MKKINTLIFDLGGVLLDIDYVVAAKKLQTLGFPDVMNFYHANKTILDNFELGYLDAENFRNSIRQSTGIKFEDSGFDAAWNSLILDLSIERLTYIQENFQQQQLFLLSNTNIIHYNFLKNQRYIQQLEAIFHKTYYSFAIQKRKPDFAAFRLILEEHKLQPDTCLFIDDTKENTDAAQQLGLNTLLYTKNNNLSDILPKIS